MSAIFGLFGSMFGTAEAGKSILGMVDNAFDTDEEKREHYLEWIKSTTNSRLARRFLAVMTMAVFFFAFLVVFGMSIFMGKDAVQVVSALSVIKQFEIPYLAMIVMGFYFTSGMVRKK